VLREHLAFTFWPGGSEAQARNSLRQHLYLLRQGLPSLPYPIPRPLQGLSRPGRVAWGVKANPPLSRSVREGLGMGAFTGCSLTPRRSV
jgi:hypothetical protein